MSTDKVDSLKIGLSGSWGNATIDWGDGTKINSNDLWSMPIYFNKSYSDKKSHAIEINGNGRNTIIGIFCSNNDLTSLNVSNNPKLNYLVILSNKLKNIDVSKNLELIELDCSLNQLKSLDVSKNTLLETLSCENNQLKSLDVRNNTKLASLFLRSNQLNATQINKLFETLHKNKIWEKTIFIGGNPGTKNCDKSIATSKGWIVDSEPVEFK